MQHTYYRPMQPADRPLVAGLMKDLYLEDTDGKPLPDAHIERTFDQLALHPEYGTILVFEQENQLVGYAVLINFWSNEYGGIVLSIDELYIVPHFRNQGIGTRFIKYLHENKYNGCIALELEVMPYNERALKLYRQLGFETSARNHLLWGM